MYLIISVNVTLTIQQFLCVYCPTINYPIISRMVGWWLKALSTQFRSYRTFKVELYFNGTSHAWW